MTDFDPEQSPSPTSSMTARRPVLGQFAWVSAGRVVAALLQAVSLILAARLLAPSAFGALAAVLGLATVVQTALDLGVSTFITRERAADPSSGAVTTALRFNNLSSGVLAGCVLIALTIAGASIDRIYYEMLPLAFWASGERNADARLSVAFADGDAKVNVFNLLARRTVAIGIFIGLDILGVDAVLAFTTASAVAAVLSSIFANFYVRRRVTAPSSITFRELIGRSWPYWVSSLATQARNLDVLVTSVTAGATQAGFYSSGSRLTSPLRILPTSLASVVLPAASRETALSRSLKPLLKMTLAAIGAMTLLYAVVLLLAPLLVRVALGAAYEPAVPVIQTVVVGLPFAAAASLFASLLQGLGKKHLVATSATLTTGLCLVMVAIGSSAWGAMGAAVALSASFVGQSAFLIVSFAVADRQRERADAQ